MSLEKDGVLSYEVRFFKMASSLHIYKTNVFAPTRKSFWNAQLSVSVQWGRHFERSELFCRRIANMSIIRGQRFLSKIYILLSWVKRYYKTIHNGYFLDGLTIFSWLFVKKTFINITSNVAKILVETLFFSTKLRHFPYITNRSSKNTNTMLTIAI